MPRSSRRIAIALPVAALILASTFLHWYAARRVAGLWIMPDEAIYGGLALGVWQHGSLPLFGGSGAGYSALYPVLVGGPLSIGSLTTGLSLLRPLQAFVMSLAAVPVALFTRRVAGERSAFAAAALTLAIPLVLYSGSLMTEVLYYPVAAAALLQAARAVATRALRDQAVTLCLVAVAVATRVQGIVLLFVFAGAVLVDAALRRRRVPVRDFLPLWGLTALATAVIFAAPASFGAYASALNGSYDAGGAVRLVYYHLADLVLMVGVVPVAAFVVVAVLERDREIVALVAVTLSATVLVLVQVGVFSSRFAPHLLERDLAALPPLLFVVFAVWLSHGARHTRLLASLALLTVGAIVLLAPWNRLVGWDAFPDSLATALLLDNPLGWSPTISVTLAATALLLIFRFVPHRELLVLLLVALFVGNSVQASHLVDAYAAGTQNVLVGTPRTWIQRATPGRVAYVYDGDLASWPVVWEQRFWNPNIDLVLSFAPNLVPGPIKQRQIPMPRDGVLPIDERYVVANDRLTFIGDILARQDRGPNQYPLQLWQLSGRARLSTIVSGVQPNGDMTHPATIRVLACHGSLELTLLPKATQTVLIDLNGRPITRAHVAGQPSWSTVVPAHLRGPCTFTVHGGALLGSTRITFVRS